MKYEWKKSLSRILIASMLICTMQSSVVAAATELSDAVDAVDVADVVDVSGGTVPADALLKDVNENGDKLIEDIRSEVLVDVDGDAEGSVLDIPAPRTSDYTIELKKKDFDLISFHNSLINLAADYPSQVVKIGEEGAQAYDFSVDVDAGDSDNSYIEVCFRKNQLELASEDNEMNYAEIRLSGESGTIPVGSYTLTPNVTDLKALDLHSTT